MLNRSGITEQIAKFVANTRFSDLPHSAIEKAKLAILDCIGVTLAGAAEPVGNKVTCFARSLGGDPQSTVIGTDFRTLALHAAFANGTMAHALDYDDSCLSMIGHPSAPVVPAVLALGELVNASGIDILLSYILGVEVEAKIGLAMNPGLCDAGWHSTDVLGSLGATVSGAKVLGLKDDETAMALAIASSQAGGFLHSTVGTMLKPLQAGLAARNGVLACLLAKDGFTAPKDILEAPKGFCTLFRGEGNPHFEKIVQNLGSPFEIVSPGLGLKPYPSCLATHGGIDATLWLRQQYNISVADVASVNCYVHYYYASILHNHKPKTALEAKFSMQFCIAIALLEGAAGLQQFKDEKVRAPLIQDLMSRIKLEVHPESQTTEKSQLRFAKVLIKMKDGTELTHRIDIDKTKGDLKMRLTQEEVQAKFVECAQKVLPKLNIDRSVEVILNLEKIREIKELSNLLTIERTAKNQNALSER